MHVGEAALDKDKTVPPSDLPSICAHVSDVTVADVTSPRCVQDILVSHLYNDPIWTWTDPCDVLVVTRNSVEYLAGAHFTNQDTKYYQPNAN